VHNSIIVALETICLECLDELDEQDKDDTRWLEQKLLTLNDDLKKNSIAKYVGYTANQLNEIELSLMSSDALPRNMEKHVKEKLIQATLIDEKTPACYKKKVEEKLSDYMCSSLATLIQCDKDLHKIFHEQLMVDIRNDLQEMQSNLNNLLSSFCETNDLLKYMLKKTIIIEEAIKKLAEKLNVNSDIIDVKIIEKNYINKKFGSEELKSKTYEWLVEGWFTRDDVFTKSKNSFVFYKKYIPVYEYTGSYSGTVSATVVMERDENRNVLRKQREMFDFEDEQFKERVTGADPSKILELKPSELGSLWGVMSNELNKIPRTIYCSDIFTNKISIPLKKKTFEFLNPVVEELKLKEYIDQLEDLDLSDLYLFEGNDVEFEELNVNLDDFISEIYERYERAKTLKKNSVVRAHLPGGDIIKKSISTTPKQLPKVHNIKIIYIPIWIAIYSYNDKKFVFAKNISNLKHGGIRPINELRILMTIILFSISIVIPFSMSVLLLYNYIETFSIFILLFASILFLTPIAIMLQLENKRKDNLKAELGANVYKQKQKDNIL